MTGERPQSPSASLGAGDVFVLAAALLLYLPFIFFGYGADNDSYGVLDAGRRLLREHRYIPSRAPGYLVYEASVAVLSRVGGSVLCNVVSVAMALLTLYCFLRICKHFEVPRRRLLAVLFAFHAVFWVNATCTMDYLWALALLSIGFLALLKSRYMFAGLLFGVAVGMRFSSFIAVGIFLTDAFWSQPRHRPRVLIAGAVALILAAALYYPSYAAMGPSMFRPGLGQPEFWTWKMHVGRYIYKNVYFWGLPAAAVLAWALFLLARRGHTLADGTSPRRSLLFVSVALMVGYQLLFMKFPIEAAYLLPLLPGALWLLGIGLRDHPRLLYAFAAASLLYPLLSLNIARPDRKDEASSAKLGLWVERGYLIENIQARLPLRHCDTLDCYVRTRLAAKERMQEAK